MAPRRPLFLARSTLRHALGNGGAVGGASAAGLALGLGVLHLERGSVECLHVADL